MLHSSRARCVTVRSYGAAQTYEPSSTQPYQAGVTQPAAGQASARGPMQTACAYARQWHQSMLITLYSMHNAYGPGHSVRRHPQGGPVLMLAVICTTGAKYSDSSDSRADSTAHAVHCHAAAFDYAIVDGGDAHPCDVARVVRCGATAPSNAKVSGRARGEGAKARLVARVIGPCSW